MSVWDYISSLDPAILVLYVIVFIALLSFGIVKVPWINWPKKKACRADGKESFCEYHERNYQLAYELGQLPTLTVHDQMLRADDLEQDSRDIAFRHYLKLVKETHGGEVDGIITETETIAYDYVLRYALSRAKDKVKFFFAENHLAELTEKEFNDKSEFRAGQIVRLVSGILNDIYPPNAEITREQLYDHNQLIESGLQKSIINLFREGREIAIQYAEKRKGLIEKVGGLEGVL